MTLNEPINSKNLVFKAFRLSKSEAETIKQNAKAEGYKHQSEFIRNRLLNDDFNLHKKLNKIELLVENILKNFPISKERNEDVKK